jgi:hypothetical protein
MGGHLFPEIPCTICSKPIDLTVDLSADENGRAVHEDCYVQRITKQRRSTSDASVTAA